MQCKASISSARTRYFSMYLLEQIHSVRYTSQRVMTRKMFEMMLCNLLFSYVDCACHHAANSADSSVRGDLEVKNTLRWPD